MVMGESNNTIDIGKFCHDLFFKSPSNMPCNSGRTIYARKNADVVTCAHSAIGADDPLECCCVFRLYKVKFSDGLAKFIVPIKVIHSKIVRMNVLTRPNIGFCNTDDLVIFTNGVAFFDELCCYLVTGINGPCGSKVFLFYARVRSQCGASDNDIISRAKSNSLG